MNTMWDTRYAVDDYIFGTQPNEFLASQQHLLKPGQKALAVADGEGRNGVWLARHGLEVLSVDASAVAIEKAKKLAAQNGVEIETEVADLCAWEWGEKRFDVIAAIFIQFAPPDEREKMFRRLSRALKPGGYLILQGYTPKQVEYKTGGPPQAENMYTEQLLRLAFSKMDIVHMRQHDDIICEGTHHCGLSALIDMVARQPA